MITQMTKYSFVLLSEQTQDFLEKLQDLGMVDINRQEKPVDEHSKELTNQLVRINQTVTRLKQVAKEKDQKKKTKKKIVPFEGDAHSMLEEATRLFSEKEVLRNDINVLNEQIKQAEPWGIFTEEDLEKIESMGVTLHAYVQPVTRLNPGLEEKYPLYVENRVDGQAYFIVLEVTG